MSCTTKDYQIKDLKNFEFLRSGPVRFEIPPGLETFIKEYNEYNTKSLERQKYDKVWELIKKKNNW